MSDVLERAAREPDAVVRYGGGELQLADLYLPSTHAAGGGRTVVLLHGGFWRNRYDRTHLRPLAEALASDGFAVALPEYRRIGDPGGGYPGTFDDAALAVAALPSLVAAAVTAAAGARGGWGGRARGRAEDGGDGVGDGVGVGGRDARATPGTTVVGHSAGGQLAIWSQCIRAVGQPEGAGRLSSPPTSAVDADRVVALAGVLDVASAHRLGLSGGVVAELLDAGRAGFAERVAEVDPMQLPVPPSARVQTVLLHGSRDAEVPVEFSRAYARREPGIRFDEIGDAGHFELIDPLSAAYPLLLAAL
ncbi:alpha/beta hydrolase [Subtercola sp. YIM 133946]|uniref:alpha/beta hydrolase n=1 Tax=Subtercola sp. YIM 133946 TaxID=3118909 RepID=UPI002F94A324